MTLQETREELVRWLKAHGVTLVVETLPRYDGPSIIHLEVHTKNVIGSIPLYEGKKS